MPHWTSLLFARGQQENMLAAASPLLSACSGETENPKIKPQNPCHASLPCARPPKENMLGENAFWHDVTVNGYQSRRFAETGDLDAVWASIRDSRDKVCVLAHVVKHGRQQHRDRHTLLTHCVCVRVRDAGSIFRVHCPLPPFAAPGLLHTLLSSLCVCVPFPPCLKHR